ncbi:MAG: exonuclease domain-containing protein [Burkholderiaceae bacterium]
MKIDWREVAAACAPGLLLAVAALLGWLISTAVLDTAQRATVGAALEPALALLLALWLVLTIGVGWWTHRGWLRRVREPALTAERAAAFVAAATHRSDAHEGSEAHLSSDAHEGNEVHEGSDAHGSSDAHPGSDAQEGSVAHRGSGSHSLHGSDAHGGRGQSGRASQPKISGLPETAGDPATRALATLIEQLVRERNGLRDEMAQRVASASRDVEVERSRLAALMSELMQSVVVCNRDGRILLYNARARALSAVLSAVPSPAAGAELIGIGRSIHALLDRRLIDHAVDGIERRLARDEPAPTARFVTSTAGGRLLRIRMAPVRAPDGSAVRAPEGSAIRAPEGSAARAPDGPAVRELGRSSAEPRGGPPVETSPSRQASGFVLMIDDITDDFAAESTRHGLLHTLTEGSRASLGTLQAAVEMLDYPDVDPATREQFVAVIRDEVTRMTARVAAVADRAEASLLTHWPLEPMPGADLLAAVRRRIASLAAPVGDIEIDLELPPDPPWLKVDSYALLQAITGLADRLGRELAVRCIALRLARATGGAHLDVAWQATAVDVETLSSWETDPIRIGDEAINLTVRDVVDRHGGEVWLERDPSRQQALFRFLLPVAETGGREPVPAIAGDGGRPEFYDFDLFDTGRQAGALADRPLAELTFTVFDTETTGLDPSAGDEIIQIGAVRIVNGRLLRRESFEQLVDPRRAISPASIAIHGITAAAVAGQPTIDTVLPAFHAFAHDTVLVGHNAAFDMRFLELKAASSRVAFDQPVLDTLLLSVLLHPNQPSHQLELIAARFGIVVDERHSALADATTTAQVFLHLLPLLAERGIVSLEQALRASRETWHARLRY